MITKAEVDDDKALNKFISEYRDWVRDCLDKGFTVEEIADSINACRIERQGIEMIKERRA